MINCKEENDVAQGKKCKKDVREELLDVLECKMCMEQIKPPIRSCINGHITCTPCSTRCNCCPVCNSSFTSGINAIMEKLAEKVDYPCTYRNAGCKTELLLKEMIEHEKYCTFKPYKCPQNVCSPCPWEGTLFLMKEHILTSHANDMKVWELGFMSSGVKFPLVYDGEMISWKDVAIYDNRIFLWYSFLRNEFLYSCVLLVGRKRNECQYDYTVTFKRYSPESSISMNYPVYNYEENLEDIVKNLDCPRFNIQYVASCLTSEGKPQSQIMLEIGTSSTKF